MNMILFKSCLNWQFVLWHEKQFWQVYNSTEYFLAKLRISFAQIIKKLKNFVYLFKRFFCARISSGHIKCNCDETAQTDFLETCENNKIVTVFQPFFLKISTGDLESSSVNLAKFCLFKLRKNFENHYFFEIFLTKLFQWTPDMQFWHPYNPTEHLLFAQNLSTLPSKSEEIEFCLVFFITKLLFRVLIWAHRLQFSQLCWFCFIPKLKKIIIDFFPESLLKYSFEQLEWTFDSFAKTSCSLSENDPLNVRKNLNL